MQNEWPNAKHKSKVSKEMSTKFTFQENRFESICLLTELRNWGNVWEIHKGILILLPWRGPAPCYVGLGLCQFCPGDSSLHPLGLQPVSCTEHKPVEIRNSAIQPLAAYPCVPWSFLAFKRQMLLPTCIVWGKSLLPLLQPQDLFLSSLVAPCHIKVFKHCPRKLLCHLRPNASFAAKIANFRESLSP